ncbi:MAG: hypothetical protein R3B96_23600 [Pirellulaceae bacterium]
MTTSRSSRFDETEQTRWWAVGTPLTAVVACLAVGYYQNAVPQGHFEDGVLVIQGQEWAKVELHAAELENLSHIRFPPGLSEGRVWKAPSATTTKAERLFEKAAESAEVNHRALALQGVVAYQRNDIEKAKQLVNEALELDGDLFEALELERR